MKTKFMKKLKKCPMNNLLMFLIITFLTACIVTLKHEKQGLKEKLESQDSLILELQSSNRIYIDKALGNI